MKNRRKTLKAAILVEGEACWPPLFSSRFLRLACFVLRSIRFPSASCKSSCGVPTSFPPPTLGDGRRGCQKTRTYRGGSRNPNLKPYTKQNTLIKPNLKQTN